MTYAQNTMTSANGGADLAAVIDGLLISAGWSLVETFNPSDTRHNSVYKSSSATNMCGYDWFITLSWDAVGSVNRLKIFAGTVYSTATHQLNGILGPPQDINSQFNVQDGQPVTGFIINNPIDMSTFLTTSSLGPVLFWGNDTNPNQSSNNIGFQTAIPSTSFGYWASITLDHLALFTTISGVLPIAISTLLVDSDYAAESFYCHTPLVWWADSFSLNSHFIGTTPISNTNYTGAHSSFTGVYGAKLPVLTGPINAVAWAPYVFLNYLKQGAGTPVFPAGTQITGLVIVGQVPDLLMVSGGSIGDTVDIDGVTYVLSGPIATNLPADIQPTIAIRAS